MNAERLFGWTPFRAAWHGPEVWIDWCHLGDGRMTEPFFYETIVNAMRQPFNLVFQQHTPAAVLAELPRGLPPCGFIFHMSRCGSTLVAQALAACESAIVVSEAAPLRTALNAVHYGLGTPETAQRLLAGLLNAYAQPRFSYERAAFVKFMAADVLDLALVRRTFPDVPWLFLFRDPLEILASQRTMGGADTAPGGIAPHRVALSAEALDAMEWEAYQFHVMAAFGRAALAEHRPGGHGLILDYADLPAALDVVFAHFGMAPEGAERETIHSAVMRDAKTPRRLFVDDRAAKQAEAAPWAAMAEAITGPTLQALRQAAAHR